MGPDNRAELRAAAVYLVCVGALWLVKVIFQW